MTTPYLEISFRRGRPFAAYLHCSACGSAVSTRALGHGLLLDSAADGSVIGIEITDPSHADVHEVCRILEQHGVRVLVADLAPLAA